MKTFCSLPYFVYPTSNAANKFPAVKVQLVDPSQTNISQNSLHTADDLFLFQASIRDEVVAVRGNVLN